jgi:osmotically-inducible protein OsmY
MRGVDAALGDSAPLERLWTALKSDPHVDAAEHPLTLALEGGTLLLEGELADVAAKTRAVTIARVLPEVQRVVDRIVVPAAVKMTDGELRDLYKRALLGDRAFGECHVVVRAEGSFERIRDPIAPRGSMVATVADGVVTLEGLLPSLGHVRLAGLLAWRLPGTRSVQNLLRAEPSERDDDAELTDAVRMALEKEPLVEAARISIGTTGGAVTLRGTLTSAEARRIAERDAWYVLGVLDVDNRIEVRPS